METNSRGAEGRIKSRFWEQNTFLVRRTAAGVYILQNNIVMEGGGEMSAGEKNKN